jgi:ankyrin repeat protein
MEWLVEKGANVERSSNNGNTALHFAAGGAAKKGQVGAMEWLVAQGAEVDATGKQCNGWTPLFFAAFEGLVTTIEWLAGKGADVNAVDVNGCTALHLAVDGGDLASIKWLVGHGVDASVEDKGGNTALQISMLCNNIEAADWLQKHERSELALPVTPLLHNGEEAAAPGCEEEGEEAAAQSGGAGAGSSKKAQQVQLEDKAKSNSSTKKVKTDYIESPSDSSDVKGAVPNIKDSLLEASLSAIRATDDAKQSCHDDRSEPEQEDKGATISLRVRLSQMKSQRFQVHERDTFGYLLRCFRTHFQIPTLIMIVDGEAVSAEQRPVDLGLKDKDVIYASTCIDATEWISTTKALSLRYPRCFSLSLSMLFLKDTQTAWQKQQVTKALLAGIESSDIAAMTRAVEAGASVTARLDEHNRGYQRAADVGSSLGSATTRSGGMMSPLLFIWRRPVETWK